MSVGDGSRGPSGGGRARRRASRLARGAARVAVGFGLAGCLGATGIGLAAVAAAQVRLPGETPVEDLLQVVVLDRELVALDARGGAGSRTDLRLGESVLRSESRGQVAVAITDQRILAVTAGSAAWQETSYHLGERVTGGPHLGDRVGLVLTSRRVIGFDGGSGNLVESDLGVRENVRAHAVGSNVAVVVTGRRALGLSPFRGGLFEATLGLHEDFGSVEARANLSTVRTSRRLLTFRAPSGSWSETRLGLGD